ncbi:MAG: CHASE domain-containing protein [Woeseiaceae bacterium]|nr:CHASE domain-containing protein [Woeseiaceae bacterium]
MGSNRQVSKRGGSVLSSKPFWAVLVLGSLLSIVGWRTVAQFEDRVSEVQFEADAMERSLLIRRQFETGHAALEDLASLYAVNDDITNDQFSRFVAPILARQPSLRALSWNPVIAPDERDAHEAAMRRNGRPDYRITVRSEAGELVAAPPSSEYVVVAFIEPYAGNESALGFDVNSQETRSVALQRARDTGSTAIAAPIALVQGRGETTGALEFLPRYRGGVVPDTVDERRANLEGYFVAVVDIAENIAAALSNVDTSEFELTVLSTGPGAEQAELFASDPSAGGAGSPESSGDVDSPSYSTAFPWAGHEIEVRFTASETFIASGRTLFPMVALLAGFMFTGLAAYIVAVLWGRTVRIANEVADRTRDIQQANEELQAEVERRTAVEKRLESHQHELERIVEERTAKLRATTAQLRTILESEPECVKIVSADGSLEDMNAAGLAMIEAGSIDEVRGCSVYSLIAKQHRDAFIDLNKRVIAGESCTLEFELDGLKGGKRLVETHAVPLVDSDGGPTRHLAITRDITAKRAFEREQAELESQLRQKQKLESIGVMAGGIAHDFNNLMQVIIGNSEIALDRMAAEDIARGSIEASYAAASDAAKLCDQMLTYAGRSRQDVEPVFLPDLVTSIVELLNVSHSKNAELELEFEAGVGMIEGDEAQLRQIVMNLVSNASEAIGEDAGRITVRVGTADLHEDASGDDWIGSPPEAGRYVDLEVSDTGCGMDAGTIERIFDPFFTTKFAGRGLGLSSTLGIIRGHEGFLSVVSDTDRGTRFNVLFPVSESENNSIPKQPESQPAVFDATILMVDDEEQVLKIGSAMLERLGCRVIPAANGKEALEHFREQGDSVDAVLLDLTMPGMSGSDTCHELRRIRPDIPVIFCSGYADDAVRQDVDSTAYTGFLHKPYVRDDLVRLLDQALSAGEKTAISAGRPS